MPIGGGGAIVNTASIAGVEGAKYLPAYVASKHAVMGLTRTSALEFSSRGITGECGMPWTHSHPHAR